MDKIDQVIAKLCDLVNDPHRDCKITETAGAICALFEQPQDADLREIEYVCQHREGSEIKCLVVRGKTCELGKHAYCPPNLGSPQDAALRESIARSWCPMPWYKAGMVVRRDSLLVADDVIKMFEAAGYHRCQKVEWPVPEIPCENCPAPSQGKEILVPDGRELRLATAPCPESESCSTYHNWLGRVEQSDVIQRMAAAVKPQQPQPQGGDLQENRLLTQDEIAVIVGGVNQWYEIPQIMALEQDAKTMRMMEAAGYHCSKREWPVLTDTQLLEADDKLGEEYFDELDQHKAWLMDRRNIAQAQRANDMKQCPLFKEEN